MNAMPGLIDQHGRPLAPSAPARRRAMANLGAYPGAFPYAAADWTSQELANWFPWIKSPDAEINIHRDRLTARNRDIVRNDGWAAGAVTQILDAAVGVHFHLVAKPDYRALRQISGIKAFDAEWADEFGEAVEARFRTWGYDPGHYNDAARQLTISQIFRVMLRHKLVDGEDLAVLYTLRDRLPITGFSTAVMGVDPDLLSNPYQRVDSKYMRGGVELDDLGVPIAYHFRKAHQNDWYNAVESMEWERVTREVDGWQRVIHDFERDRFGQNRGIGIFTPVLARLKMLARYDAVEMQAAIISTILGTFITSPYDTEMVRDAVQDSAGEELTAYQGIRSEFHRGNPISLAGARIPMLAPGEKIETVAPQRPNSAFEAFEQAMLRNVSAVTGQSAEQTSKDWSQTNYSSARGALLEAWRTLHRRRSEFAVGTANPIYTSWLDEGMDLGYFPLPRNAPPFMAARAAYARCRWLGPGRGWVDPVKEKQGAILGMDAAIDTLEQQCAEMSGTDWRENLDQRALEVKAFKERGLELPDWGHAAVATETDTKPEAQ